MRDVTLQRKRQAEWARRNRETTNYHRRKHQRTARERVAKMKEETPCKDCGGNFPSVCMHFDHLPEYKKLGNVATMVSRNKSWDAVKAEIDKCEIVCANCHAIRTARRLDILEVRTAGALIGLENRDDDDLVVQVRSL